MAECLGWPPPLRGLETQAEGATNFCLERRRALLCLVPSLIVVHVIKRWLKLTCIPIVCILFTCAVAFYKSFSSSNSIEGEAYYASEDYVYHQIKSIVKHHCITPIVLVVGGRGFPSPQSCLVLCYDSLFFELLSSCF